jgi:sulfite exporter TauE/SafE
VLLIAALQVDAFAGASTMAAFGLGTAPALLATAFGAQRLTVFAAKSGVRHAAGSVLAISAVLTLLGPWLIHALPGLHGWLPFDCSVH